MNGRHRCLYDIERWRRSRFFLILAGTGLLFFSLATPPGEHPTLGGTLFFSIPAAILYALAISFWMRQRSTYLEVRGDALLIRVVGTRLRVPLQDLRRVKVGRLVSVFNEAGRRRLLPRPINRWMQREAIIIRLPHHSEMTVKLRRILGSRCVIGDDLVLPLIEPQTLLEQITRAEKTLSKAESLNGESLKPKPANGSTNEYSAKTPFVGTTNSPRSEAGDARKPS